MKKLVWISIVVIGLILFASVGKALMPLGYECLVLEKPTDRADILIVLAGDRGHRVKKAVDLYHEGIAPMILMSGGGQYFDTYFTEMMGAFAESLGVPKKAILQEKHSLSTYADAVESRKLIETLQHKPKRILIVTSKFHTRRSFRVFRKQFPSDEFDLFVIGSDDFVRSDAWWQHHEMAQTILTEWAKSLVYYLKY